MSRREFHYSDGKSDKFWAIALAGQSYTIHFGRQGTAGQQQIKTFATDAEAEKACNKLIAEKLKKGYVEVIKGSILLDALERIHRCLQQQSPESAASLQPGLSLTEIESKVAQFPFRLPDEVYQLYQWRNGSTPRAALQFLPMYGFLSLDDALREYQQITEICSNLDGVEDWKTLYDPRWLPLFAEEGNYYVVQGNNEPKLAAPILDKFSEDDSVLLFDTLAQMMQALAECWESGVYQVQRFGYGLFDVESDEAEAHRIWLKYRPQRADTVVMLTDNNPDLSIEERMQGYIDLVTTQHPEALSIIQAGLQTSLQTNPEKCYQIISLLGLLKQPEAIDVLIDLLTCPHEQIRAAAVSTLAWTVDEARLRQFSGVERGIAPLLEMLRNREMYHRDVAKVLGRIGDLQVVEPLITLLAATGSMSGDTRLEAIAALEKIGDTRVANLLFQVGQQDNDPTVQFWAGRALRVLGDSRGLQVLTELAELELPVVSQLARELLNT